MERSGEITSLLREWGEGRHLDADALFDLVYPNLRVIAGALFHGERQENLLQPTGVVNELFLKLVQHRKLDFQDRHHFYSFAARLMRRILVDYARSERRMKRDGGTQVPMADNLSWFESSPADIIDVDCVLAALEHLDPRKCRMVELRFLLGFTAEETADLMNLSKASVDRDLRFARSWLQEQLTHSPRRQRH